MSTWLISGITVNSSRTRSASAFSARTSVWPEMEMSVTWLRAVSSRMMGLSVWSGKVVIASTLFLTSSTTRRGSAPSSSSTMTEAMPSERSTGAS